MILALVAAAMVSDPPPAPIEVVVQGVTGGTGEVVVAICPEQQFLQKCPWSAKAPASDKPVTLVVRGVPPGRYAVQAFHDVNGNGVLDTYWFGLPKEAFGFSNDAMRRLSRPRFDKAAFVHGSSPQRVAVTLRSLLR